MQLAQLAERFYGSDLVQQRVAVESVQDDRVLSRAGEIAERLAGFDLNSHIRIKKSVRVARGVDDFRQLIKSVRDVPCNRRTIITHEY